MAAHRIFNYFGRVLVCWLTVTALLASEHHGVVKANGMPIPGAVVTATEAGQKTQVTTTDDNGAYAFADLPDGIWTITVEMLGFAKLTREIGVASDSPSPSWELKVQSLSDLNAAVAAAKKPATAPAPATAAATPATAASAVTGETPKPAATAEDKPATRNNGRNRKQLAWWTRRRQQRPPIPDERLGPAAQRRRRTRRVSERDCKLRGRSGRSAG